jgi:hypothetical protein
MTDPHSAMRSAHWCFRALRSCTDPELAAELRFMARTLLARAREKLLRMRTRRKALAGLRQAG